jgi:hypothetical protein
MQSSTERYPIHVKVNDSAAEENLREKLNMTAPKTCRTQAEKQEVVLSCISLPPSGKGRAEVVEPLASAINATAPDITLLDVSIFGCRDTAVFVQAERVLLSVRSRAVVGVGHAS